MERMFLMLWLVGCSAVHDAPVVAPEAPATPAEAPATLAEDEQNIEPPAGEDVTEAPPTATEAEPTPKQEAVTTLGADGTACLEHTDCESGVCEGLGCGPDAPGTCARIQRPCTRDARPFCGCDGVTFFTSSSCPRKRYQSAGACPEDPAPPLGRRD